MAYERFDPGFNYSDLVMKKVLLDKMALTSRRSIHKNVLLQDAKLSLIDHVAGELVMELRAYVWSQKLQDEKATLTVEYPDGAWQAFKKRWFPRWALLRWPVKNAKVSQSHTFKTIALLPEFNYQSPEGCGTAVIGTFTARSY